MQFSVLPGIVLVSSFLFLFLLIGKEHYCSSPVPKIRGGGTTFNVMAATFNRLNVRPVVIFAGDQCQQQPLQTVDGRTSATTSIINDHTFTSLNAIRHTLHQQFRITDPEYAVFLDLIRFTQPTQEQVDRMKIADCAIDDAYLPQVENVM